MAFRFQYFTLPIACIVCASAEVVWETDMEAAISRAGEEGKGILVCFLGPEGDGVSNDYFEQVLGTPEFIEKMEPDHVLLKIRETGEEAGVRKIMERYAIDSFPRLVFTDSCGRPYHSLSGDLPFLVVMRELERVDQLHQIFLRDTARLESLRNEARYSLIGKMMRTITQRMAEAYYKDLLEEVKEKDVRNVSGLIGEPPELEQEKMIAYFMDSMVDKINESPIDAIWEIERFSRQEHLLLESRQTLLAQTAYIMASMGKPDDAVERLQEAIDILPYSVHVRQLVGMQETFREYRDEIIRDAIEEEKQRKNALPGESGEDEFCDLAFDLTLFQGTDSLCHIWCVEG